MKLLIISGSRNPEGQTARASRAVLDGFVEAGGEGKMIFLAPMHIERCRQCKDDGWGLCTEKGRCVIEDDIHSLIAEIRAADMVLFSTPVYFSDLSESLKTFLDRLRRTCLHDDGNAGIKEKPAVGVCVAGGGGGGAPQCCVSMEWILKTTGFDLIDVIPARRQNLEAKIPVLKETGRQLAAYLKK